VSLPPATTKPCIECPWRRAAVPGYLGPYEAAEWTEIAHGESAIACHMTIPAGVDGEWSDGMLQCRGAAIFRANVCKLPRDPRVVTGPMDTHAVFAANIEFLAHHARVRVSA
jgi:hypothetical protein